MTLLLRYADPAGRPRARLLRGAIRVGTDPRAGGILLHGNAVADEHAVIDANHAPPRVSVLAPGAALFVNGLLVASSALADGDAVRFGDVETRVELASRWAEEPARLDVSQARPDEKARVPPVRPAFLAVLFTIFAAVYVLSQLIARARPASERGREGRGAARTAPTVAHASGALTAESSAPSAASSGGREAPVRGARRVSSLETESTDVIEEAMKSVVSISGDVRIDGRPVKMLGSGFFISEAGLILTNAHVMSHEGTYVARDYSGIRLDVQPRERDVDADLGILAVEGRRGFRTLPFGSTGELRPGARIFAIGSPLAEELSFTVTQGIVSSGIRKFDGHAFLQHDAAISPGNSGGPLLDAAGRVVGINTWKIAGGAAQGLSFAIPIEVAEELLRTWKVDR